MVFLSLLLGIRTSPTSNWSAKKPLGFSKKSSAPSRVFDSKLGDASDVVETNAEEDGEVYGCEEHEFAARLACSLGWVD
jgi:hypothetical protein